MPVTIADFTVSQAARAIASGTIGSEELVRALLDRLQAASALPFVAFDADHVLFAARRADRLKSLGRQTGRLHGVPLSFKDNINVAGFPTSAGTPLLRGFRPERDAPIAAAFRRAGAFAFAKTGMHELACGVTSNNTSFGAPSNPFDQKRSAGGSSGGCGSSVGARLVPASIGTDTGGSVRIPAAFCGVWGYRPSTGRWPTNEIVPISSTRDTPGPIARSGEDLALLDEVVTGQAVIRKPSMKEVRIGVPTSHYWEGVAPEIRSICQRALDRIVSEGASLVEIDVRHLLQYHNASSMVVSLYEIKTALGAFLTAQEIPFGFEDVVAQVASPDVHAVLSEQLDPARNISREAYEQAMTVHRPALLDAHDRLFSNNRIDFVCFPTCRVVPPLLGDCDFVEIDGVRSPAFPALIHNTDLGSNVGAPGLSVPVGLTTGGLPVGLGFDAARSRDLKLLGFSLQLDSLFPCMRPESLLESTH